MFTSEPGLCSPLPHLRRDWARCLLGASRAARRAQPQRSAFAQVRSIGFVLGYGLLVFAERRVWRVLYRIRSAPVTLGVCPCRCAHSQYRRRAPPPAPPHAFQASRALPAPTAVANRWLRAQRPQVAPDGSVLGQMWADVVAWASPVPAQMWHGCAQPRSAAAAHAEPERGTPMPHLHRDSAHPWPHLHRDSARLCHICTGTGSTCPPPWCSIGRTLYSLRSVAHSEDSAARHCRTLLAARSGLIVARRSLPVKWSNASRCVLQC